MSTPGIPMAAVTGMGGGVFLRVMIAFDVVVDERLLRGLVPELVVSIYFAGGRRSGADDIEDELGSVFNTSRCRPSR